MENYQYVTYKFYDEKSRRLTIFGTKKEDKLQIVTITCSSKDYFSKKRAKALFDAWIYSEANAPLASPIIVPHPVVVEIPIEDEKPKFTFMNYCKSTYKRITSKEIVIQFQDIKVEDMKLVKKKGKYILELTHS